MSTTQKLYFILQNGNCVYEGNGKFTRRFPTEFINSYNEKHIHFLRGQMDVNNVIVSNLSFHSNIVQKNTDYDSFIGIMGVVYDGRKKWKQLYTNEYIEFYFKDSTGEIFIPTAANYNFVVELMLEY